MELENLLRRASAAPLGPLSFTFTPSGPDAWTLTVTFRDKSQEVRAERDAATQGLVLSCNVDAEAQASFDVPWVTYTRSDETSGQTERRLWLHGDGLSSALLLNSLAALMRGVAGQPDTPDGIVVEKAKIIVPSPLPAQPEPAPIERPKPLGWNSFGFGRREEPDTAAITSPPEAETEAAADTEAVLDHPVEATSAGQIETEAETIPVAVKAEGEPTTSLAEPMAQPERQASVDTVHAVGKAGYCRECGSPYLPDHAFCTNCGAKLDQTGE